MPTGGADILLTLGVDTSQVKQIQQVTKQALGGVKPPVAEGFGAHLKNMEDGTKKVATSSGRLRTQLRALQMQEKSVGTTTGTTASKLRLLNTYQAKGGALTKSAIRYKGMLTTRYKKLDTEMKKVHKTGGRTLLSMAKWAAGWMILYGGFRKILNAIGDVLKSYGELDDAMARVSTVNFSLGKKLASTMAMMRKEVLDYTATSRAELTDVAKTMYFLGTAGLNVSQQMAGFESIMNLTIGTLGNIDEIGKLVAGSFNVFSKSLRGAVTDGQKFKQIADILAYTYASQQVELSEISSAFTLVGSAAGLANIEFKTLVGTLGFLNTGMLKGTRAGTCYDEETEVLTSEGFKFWKDVTMKDDFATLNPKTHELQYQSPSKIIKEDYEGPMYKVVNKHLDLCVTPNHWMYTKDGQSNSHSKYEAKQAKDIFGKQRTYVRGAEWQGETPKYFILPAIVSNRGKNKEKTHIPAKKILIETFVEFMGFYLSEGCVSTYKNKKGGSYYRVLISQTKRGRHFKKIERCLNQFPFNFVYRKYQFCTHSQQFFSYLQQFGKSSEKYIPQFIKDLNPELLRIFLKAYNIGDGDKKFRIVTSSKKMRDDLEECALKAGYGVQHYKAKYVGQRRRWKKYSRTIIIDKHDIWSVNISNRTEFSARAKRRIEQRCKVEERWIQYSGKIYCCVVPNHIVFVRRNGKTVWCMQSIMNAFIKIARNSDMLTEKLGITFDPSKPLDFVGIMEKLSVAIGVGAISTEKLRVLMEIFGLRGARAITAILGRFEDWKKAIDVSEKTFADYAELMRMQMEDTLPGAIKKLGNALKISLMEGFGPTLKIIEEIVKKINKSTKAEIDRNKETELGYVLLGKTRDEWEAIARENALAEIAAKKYKFALDFGPVFTRSSRAIKKITDELIESELKAAGIHDQLYKLKKLDLPAEIKKMREEMDLTDKYGHLITSEMQESSKLARQWNVELKKAKETTKTELELQQLLTDEFAKIYGMQFTMLSGVQLYIKGKAKELAIQTEINSASKELMHDEKVRLATVRDELKIESLRNAGVKEHKILQQEIFGWVNKIARGAGAEEKKVRKILSIKIKEGETAENIFLAIKKYGVKVKDVVALEKLRAAVAEEILEKTREITDIFTTQVEEGLYRIIKMTGTWSDMISSIADELLKLQLKRVVHEVSVRLFETPSDLMLTAAGKFDAGVDKFTLAVNSLAGGEAKGYTSAEIDKILKETILPRPAKAEAEKSFAAPGKEEAISAAGLFGVIGLGKIIAKARKEEPAPSLVPGELDRILGEAGESFSVSIKDAFSDSISFFSEKIGFAGEEFSTASILGLGEAGKGFGSEAMKAFGAKKEGKSFADQAKGSLEAVFGKQGKGLGGRMPGIVGGAAQVFQASQAGGGMGGALSGAMGGGMMGMQLGGPWGAAIGAVAGGVLGFFGKKKSEETKHQTLQIASRIDMTNKQLSIVNRNLVSLKRSFEGYILPSSAYFAEGQASGFQLSNMRGYYG